LSWASDLFFGFGASAAGCGDASVYDVYSATFWINFGGSGSSPQQKISAISIRHGKQQRSKTNPYLAY
jgi:hypothetical protein